MTDRPAIKPLEWEKTTQSGWTVWRAKGLGVTYECAAKVYNEGWMWGTREDDTNFDAEDEEAAKAAAQADRASRIRSCLLDKPEAVEGEDDAPIEAAEAGWNACRRQVYLLSEDYIERTHPLKGADTLEGNFYRGQYDVAKSFAKAFSAFEARDCDYFRQIDFTALAAKEQQQQQPSPVDSRELIERLVTAWASVGHHEGIEIFVQPDAADTWNALCAILDPLALAETTPT